jgi:phosphohistidine phosphatase
VVPVTRTLVVLRHAKSDWDVVASDRERPLTRRGRRQAGEAGRWLASYGPRVDLAVVSPARRARDTWDLASAEWPAAPPARVDEAAYTFDGDDLLRLVRSLGEARSVVLVSHNPAVEELVAALTGEWATMPTSCLAVVELDDWGSSGRLVAHGRPPEGEPA